MNSNYKITDAETKHLLETAERLERRYAAQGLDSGIVAQSLVYVINVLSRFGRINEDGSVRTMEEQLQFATGRLYAYSGSAVARRRKEAKQLSYEVLAEQGYEPVGGDDCRDWLDADDARTFDHELLDFLQSRGYSRARAWTYLQNKGYEKEWNEISSGYQEQFGQKANSEALRKWAERNFDAIEPHVAEFIQERRGERMSQTTASGAFSHKGGDCRRSVNSNSGERAGQQTSNSSIN